MQQEVYTDFTVNDDFSMFEFSSIGKRDSILKKILFTPTGITSVYNLSLGDIDEMDK